MTKLIYFIIGFIVGIFTCLFLLLQELIGKINIKNLKKLWYILIMEKLKNE